MKNYVIYTILAFALCSCIKSEDPCYGDKHIKADFYMKEICNDNSCPDFWQDYQTSYCSSGYIRLISTSITNAFPIRNNDTISYEWHIGSKIYHGDSIYLNFGTAPDGADIPIMLIIKQRPDSACIKNDNGIDTITKKLKIDYHTFLCYGRWSGSYSDSPTDTSNILIGKGYSAAASDSTVYIKYLYPATIDTLMGYKNDRRDFRQEISVVLGSNNISAYGNALTDSSGQNITITYVYTLFPSTKIISKTFKGKKIQ